MGRPLGSDGGAQPDLSNHLDEDRHETRQRNASALSQSEFNIRHRRCVRARNNTQGVYKFQHHCRGGIHDHNYRCTRKHTTLATDKSAIRPFQKVNFPEAELTELRRRINNTKWPERETVTDATQGVQLATTQALARYWAHRIRLAQDARQN